MFELPKVVETVVNVLSIAITFFGWLPFSRWILKLRARSRFWGITAPKEKHIRVVIGKVAETAHPRGYNYTTVAAADAEAAAHIISGLALAYGSKYKLSSRPCSAFTADFWNEP